MNREGVLGGRGKQWSISTVRDILTNAKYTGSFVRFKYQCGKYHAVRDGEIVPRRKSDKWEQADEPIVVEDHHKPIVSRKMFDRVQAKLARQQKWTAHREGYQYIFSGLLRCGDCGGGMNGASTQNQKRLKRYRLYRCRTFDQQGKSACHCNIISEVSLLDCVVRLIQQNYLSDQAIDRLLVKFRKRLAARQKVVPVDDGRLRQRIEDLDRQIDRGAERVFSAPETLVGTIYAKLDKLREERDRLKAQLQAAECHQDGTDGDQEQMVEAAAAALRDLRQAFKDSDPGDVRELISAVVSKIELHYSHINNGKRDRNLFQQGTIFVRPADPALSLMFGGSAA